MPNPVSSTIVGKGSNMGLEPQVSMTNFQHLEYPYDIHQSGKTTTEGACASPIPGMPGKLNLNYLYIPLQSGNI
jgi:hypothetical protein